MNPPDSARSYVSFGSAMGSPQESARSRGSWDSAYNTGGQLYGGSSGEVGGVGSAARGGDGGPYSSSQHSQHSSGSQMPIGQYPYPLDSARSRGSWESPADQFYSPRATFRSNSGSDEWITPRADVKGEVTPRDRNAKYRNGGGGDSFSYDADDYPLTPVAEAKSSYNNGLNDSYGDSEGYDVSLGRTGVRDESKVGGMVGTLLLNDGHGHGHGQSPSPSRRLAHHAGGPGSVGGGGSDPGMRWQGADEDLGLSTGGFGVGPDDDAAATHDGGGGGAEAMTEADLDAALNSGMVDGISEQDVEDIFSYARHGRNPDVERLLDRGIPVNVRDVNGNTILTIACQNGSKRVAKCVLRRGADLNVRNYKGNTPLHYCYHYGYGETLGDYLVSKGADASLRNNAGQACYQGI